ncbi:dienelactone hydrolase family protein [Bosea sp. LjRoot237]|uniref:dienelactone hydrolase family protein n=1 Tax=Bosea sp. LjRoot237 TaxID=3342292 RepID=UPI003ECF22FE
MIRLCSVAAAICLLTAAAGAQSIALKDMPPRVELHAFPSLTISDSQFLAGDEKGKEITLTGALSLAQGSGRLPVAVLMHGSGGIGGNIEYWKRQLHAIGVSTFVIDGLTGRGLMRVGDNQAALGRLNFILDSYRSLDILAKHPRVDPDRIVMMGFSRGGQAALYSSVSRFQKLWNRSGAEFAAYVVFYPDCATTYRNDTEVTKRPIRIFHGTPDDYNPVAPCKAFVERLKAQGADVQLTEYPNAPHGFDNPLGANPPVPARADQSVRECRIREDESAVLINEATKARFNYGDECVRTGPTVGADPGATRAATVAVIDFVRSVAAPK